MWPKCTHVDVCACFMPTRYRIFKSITNNYNHCICLQFIISFIMHDAFTKSPLLFAIMISFIHSSPDKYTSYNIYTHRHTHPNAYSHASMSNAHVLQREAIEHFSEPPPVIRIVRPFWSNFSSISYSFLWPFIANDAALYGNLRALIMEISLRFVPSKTQKKKNQCPTNTPAHVQPLRVCKAQFIGWSVHKLMFGLSGMGFWCSAFPIPNPEQQQQQQ